MPKITAQEIADLGFAKEMFGKSADPDFTAFVDSVIAVQSGLLEGRIGSEAYAAASSPQQERVARAELCLVAAELLQVRINRIIGAVVGSGQEISVENERQQRKDYRDEAAELIDKVVNQVQAESGTDLLFGVVTTSHLTA